MSDRRSFLRDLASLPMIGGGVTLIGNPTAAAVPVTDALLEHYGLFLAIEAREALIECRERRCVREGHPDAAAVMREWTERCISAPDSPWMRGLLHAGGRPSTRAAVVLSAAGVPVDGGRHG